MTDPKRITVFVGHYGSGKTELAVNYAIALRKIGKKVIIVDFDIVNPYFRTKDAEEVLNTFGIEVIAPKYANMNIENPALPPEIYHAFDDKDSYVIFDVGGDDDGAIPLGRYHSRFADEECDVFFVLNERRMFTSDIDGALEILGSIEAVSRLKVTAVINNTHLKEETTPDVIERGEKFAEEFSKRTGLPVAFTSGTPEVLEAANIGCTKFPIENYIRIKF